MCPGIGAEELEIRHSVDPQEIYSPSAGDRHIGREVNRSQEA